MNTARHYQTIIVGGGPGGLACAAALAGKGVKVLLLERKPCAGPKVCAGGVTWSGMARNIPDHLIEKHFPRQYIVTPWQKVLLKDKHPLVSTVNRQKIGHWMTQKACDAGTVVQTGKRVMSITEDEVITESERFSYDFLVGADGSNSIVRRFLKIPTESIGYGVHYNVPGDFRDMVWHLEPQLFHTGYAWIFPHKTSASVGAYSCRGGIAPTRLKENLHLWMQKHGMNRKGLKPAAAIINFDYRGYHFGNRFLVGDAAGLASGLTGEGIYPAVLSGETVAHRIAGPGFNDDRLQALIKKQKVHNRLLRLTGKNTIICRMVLEAFVAALRARLIPWEALEMG